MYRTVVFLLGLLPHFGLTRNRKWAERRQEKKPSFSCLLLVASFVNLPNLLNNKEKTRVDTARTPLERMRKTCRDHAHSVLRTPPVGHPFF